MLHSYSSPLNLGHRGLTQLFDGPVVVEEKVDGSQISFGCTADGELLARSKGAPLNFEFPQQMFKAGLVTIQRLFDEGKLIPGYTYRGEYLSKPKHNALAYDRIPVGHIILFDVDKGDQSYVTPAEKRNIAEHLGLEVVPTFEISGPSPEALRALLDNVSILGGQKIEGFVIKPLGRDLYGADKKLVMGKFVSEAFKETHSKAWSESNPGGKDIIGTLAACYATQARWQKAVQHLRERGEITDSPKDIGLIMREVNEDTRRECEQEIKEALFKWGWKLIGNGLTRGLADWYKNALLEQQFVPASQAPTENVMVSQA